MLLRKKHLFSENGLANANRKENLCRRKRSSCTVRRRWRESKRAACFAAHTRASTKCAHRCANGTGAFPIKGFASFRCPTKTIRRSCICTVLPGCFAICPTATLQRSCPAAAIARDRLRDASAALRSGFKATRIFRTRSDCFSAIRLRMCAGLSSIGTAT